MSEAGRVDRVRYERGRLAPYLLILGEGHAVHFREAFTSAAGRFMGQGLTGTQFGALVSELIRDAKGTAAAVSERRRASVARYGRERGSVVFRTVTR